MSVKTVAKKALEGWTVKFTIGVQTFSLGDLESKERADWYKKMLDTAFKTLEEKTIKQYKRTLKKK